MLTALQIVEKAQRAVANLAEISQTIRECRKEALELEKVEREANPFKSTTSLQAVRLKNLSHRLKDCLETSTSAHRSLDTTLKFTRQAIEAENPKPELREGG